jgi:hypothetical protein
MKEAGINKKGAGCFFCMNCLRAKTMLFVPEKVACPALPGFVCEKHNG